MSDDWRVLAVEPAQLARAAAGRAPRTRPMLPQQQEHRPSFANPATVGGTGVWCAYGVGTAWLRAGARDPTTWRPIAVSTATSSRDPASTMTDSTRNRSASGPKTIIDSGIATDITIPYRPKTRPRSRSSTRSCSSVVAGTSRVWNSTQITRPAIENDQKFDESPRPTVSTPTPSAAPTISDSRRATLAPSAAIMAPPTSMPTLQNSSLTLSIQTASPKLRVIISGVRWAGAPAMNMTTATRAMIRNTEPFRRT